MEYLYFESRLNCIPGSKVTSSKVMIFLLRKIREETKDSYPDINDRPCSAKGAQPHDESRILSNNEEDYEILMNRSHLRSDDILPAGQRALSQIGISQVSLLPNTRLLFNRNVVVARQKDLAMETGPRPRCGHFFFKRKTGA